MGLIKLTLLQRRQPGTPRSLANDQNWRDVAARRPTTEQTAMIRMIEHMVNEPAIDPVP